MPRRADSLSDAIYRRAARILVTDPDRRLLMFLVEARPGFCVWITPGGGLDGDETWEQAARRELREEVGIEVDELGPPVWTRRHAFTWREKSIDQDERYFWVPGVSAELQPPPATESEPWIDVRWWSLEEIRAVFPHLGAEGDNAHHFAPRRIADLVEDLFRSGPPAEPIDTGV